jgi:hypothetical protein
MGDVVGVDFEPAVWLWPMFTTSSSDMLMLTGTDLVPWGKRRMCKCVIWPSEHCTRQVAHDFVIGLCSSDFVCTRSFDRQVLDRTLF